MKKNSLLLLALVAFVAVAGCKEIKKQIELVTSQGGLHPLTKPIPDIGTAEKFVQSLSADLASDNVVAWPKSKDGKNITSWYVDYKYIEAINTELSKLTDATEKGIRLYPVKNDEGNFSLMLVGNYTAKDGKDYILRNVVGTDGKQDPKGAIAPMFEWIDPCPNRCPENDIK